jgi:hypothetical protein
MAVWCSLWSFGILFPIWSVLTKKNLATLERKRCIMQRTDGRLPSSTLSFFVCSLFILPIHTFYLFSSPPILRMSLSAELLIPNPFGVLFFSYVTLFCLI